ncbi:hypothetical protein HY947_04015 [Candidatus Gottesmanbacteria bacterium]|nr:hypothetical protein [Candidatus Gottesmanbacteria bacterium]
MLTNVLAYAYHLFLGRIMGPEQYGELAALLSLFYIINAPSVVIQTILVKFFSVFYAKKQFGKSKQLFLDLSKLSLVVLLAGFVVLLPFSSFVSSFLQLKSSFSILLLFCIFSVFFFTMVTTSMLQAFQLFTSIAVVTNLGAMLRLIAGIIAAPFGVLWVLFSNILSNIAGFLFSCIPLRFVLKTKASKVEVSKKSALSYSVPTFFAIIAISAIYSQDVILVKHYFSAHISGIYSALSVLGKVIFFASSSIGIVAFPVLAEKKELKKPFVPIFSLSLFCVAGISLAITTIYFLFPSFVVSLLFGHAFDEASMYLGPFGVFLSFFSLSYLLVNMYLALGKTRVWIFACVASLLQIALTVMFHEQIGQIILNNTLVSGGLFAILLLYYLYVR